MNDYDYIVKNEKFSHIKQVMAHVHRSKSREIEDFFFPDQYKCREKVDQCEKKTFNI
jgi:cell division protein YceG involved in septum cleavage